MSKIRGNPPRVSTIETARRRIVVDLDADLHRRLVEARAATGRAIARLAVDAITAYLDAQRAERATSDQGEPPSEAA